MTKKPIDFKTIKGGEKKNEMKDLIENVKENLVYEIQLREMQAKLYRVKFDACIKEGFTSEQSLELCKI